MPQKTTCRDCGFILYEDMDLKSPDEIIEQYDGRCPQCGKKLTFVPSEVYVKPAEGVSVPRSATQKTEEQPYKETPPGKKIPPGAYPKLDVDFTVIVSNAFNSIITGLDLYKDVDTPPIPYEILSEIENMGGAIASPRPIHPVSRIRLPLGADRYSDAKHAVEVRFHRSYVSRVLFLERTKHPFTWKVLNPKGLPSKLRKKYRKKILKKAENLAKIIEKHKGAKSQQTE